MVQLIVPDKVTAGRLAAIARTAFEGRESDWSEKDFIALGGPPRAAMIVDDDFEAGLLIMQVAADEAEILNFGVIPSARRRGLGRALLTAAESLARYLGLRRIFLEVAVDNAPAIALYASQGYAELRRRKRYYRRPDGSRADALVMRKAL
jgi:ribosomal-protein-alanine N-acetyltransferase